MRGFLEFVRKQGVVGLATGFILGGAVSKLVTAIVNDFINPLVGLVLGSAKDLADASFTIGNATFMWGNLLSTFIDFLAISFVVYAGFKFLKLDRLDKKD